MRKTSETTPHNCHTFVSFGLVIPKKQEREGKAGRSDLSAVSCESESGVLRGGTEAW